MGIDKNPMDIRLDPSMDALRANLCDSVLTPILDPLLQEPINDEVEIEMNLNLITVASKHQKV